MRKLICMLLVLVMLPGSAALADSATDALKEMYAQAELLMAQGDYMSAAGKFEAMGAYGDASQMAMYCKAVAAAESMGLYSVAVDAFTSLGDFKDSRQMAAYYEARSYEAAGVADLSSATDSELDMAYWACGEAETRYAGMLLFKDSMTRMAAVQKRQTDIRLEQNARVKARKEAVYQSALALEQNGSYQEAIQRYKSIDGYESYRDVPARIAACEDGLYGGTYQEAMTLYAAEDYDGAAALFLSVSGYRDAKTQYQQCLEAKKQAELAAQYQAADALYAAEDYQGAYEAFSTLGDYLDSCDRAAAAYAAKQEQDYQSAETLEREGRLTEAAAAFEALGGYRDASRRALDCRYAQTYGAADDAMARGEFREAYRLLVQLPEDYRKTGENKALCYFRMGGNPEEKHIYSGLLDFTFRGGYVSTGYDVFDQTGRAVFTHTAMVREVKDGLMVVRREEDTKLAVMDFTGRTIIDYTDRKILLCGEERIITSQNGTNVILYHRTGRELVSFGGNYRVNGTDYSCGLFSIRDMSGGDMGKCGFMDVNGGIVINCQYDNVSKFSDDGLSVVKKGKKYLIIDTSGKTVKDLGSKYTSVSAFSNGAAVASNKSGSWMINASGKQLFKHSYFLVWFYQERMACPDDSGLYGYRDKTGKFVIEPQWQNAGNFMANGRAVVTKVVDGKTEQYLIDTSGSITAGPYQMIGESDGDVLLARRDGAYYLIDGNGNILY
ncbi:MAG: WG repeat-containing protein [Clostridia bacterium]|nr:WG repeat-containing protein [Clostridia bacterium]